MFYFAGYDSYFWYIIVPIFVLGLLAQAAVKNQFNRFSQVKTKKGITGAQAARQILKHKNLQSVKVELATGFLSDHYDPKAKKLRLSDQVYKQASVASVGIAAHEVGHALQDKDGYWALNLRSGLVPFVQFGSWLGPIIFMSGLMLQYWASNSQFGLTIAWGGVLLYAAVAAFSLITLPVELDASNRAKKLIADYHIVTDIELSGVRSVLNAAAWTYVVAAVAAIAEVIRWILILISRRD